MAPTKGTQRADEEAPATRDQEAWEALEAEAARWRGEAEDLQRRGAAAAEHRQQAVAVAQTEVQELRAGLALTEERAQMHEQRAAHLCTEGQQTAKTCSVVVGRFDQQVELSATLQRMLRRSEAETQALRTEVRELVRGEAPQAAEPRALQLQEEAFRDAARAEVRAARQQAQDARRRAEEAEEAQQRLRGEARELEAALNAARGECASLGRKCYAGYEAARRSEEAMWLWQRQVAAAQHALARKGGETQAALQALSKQEERATTTWARNQQLQDERDRAVKLLAASEEAGRDLRAWLVTSMGEMNRSAHAPRDPFAPDANPKGFAGRSWVETLEAFRERQQILTGFGNRTR